MNINQSLNKQYMKPLNQYLAEKLIINKDYVDVNIVTPESFDELRKIIEDRYKKLGPGTKENPIDFNDIDVSNIDSFCNDKGIGLFEGTKFKYIDISDWDVSNATNMTYMFYACKELKSVGDISEWDVSKVINMSFMFTGCKKINQDISKWNVSNVTDMSYMFYYCENFNQDISVWDISKVLYKSCAFCNCPIKEEYKPKFK